MADDGKPLPNSAATFSESSAREAIDQVDGYDSGTTYEAEKLGLEGGKTNEAFLLEWEPDDSPTHSHLGPIEHYDNTNNNARVSASSQEETNQQLNWSAAADGVELSNISLPNDTSPSGKPNSFGKSRQVEGKAWTDDKKMSVADVNGHALSEQQIAEYKIKQQELRDREPLRFCRWVTEKPCLFFGLTLASHCLFLFVTAILVRTGYDILPITFDRLPLDIRDDVDYLRGLAWTQRDNTDQIVVRGGNNNPANLSERSETAELLELLFYIKGGNVFTQENLKLMKNVEDDFYNNPEFQSKFCLLDSAGSCTKARSILRYFDGTYSALDPDFNDPGFNNVNGVLYKAYTNNITKRALQYHLGKYASIEANSAVSEITRGYLLLGTPLKGYSNSSDRSDEQNDLIKDFMLKQFKEKAENYYKSGVGSMKFIYNSGTLIGLTITSQVFKDMALAIGSLLFIILFVCIQTGSLWTGLFAIFSIIASFTEANLIYRVVCDFRYFGIFHVLGIFIILGIGADDVFVFFDTWKESSHHQYKTLGHRLSDCYRKASLAMLFTSTTTAIAFAISATSPFLGINSFGVFACILVLVNYLSVIIFFPCVVVTYHLWWEKYKCCCCCQKQDMQTAIPDDGPRKNIIVRFFSGPYFRFITHKVGRWFILLFFAILLSVSIYFASTLKVNEEQVKFLPDNSNFGQYLSLRSDAFASTSESGSKVLLVWGLKPQSLAECHKTDPSCFGSTVWDDTFNLNSADAQNKLLTLCNDIKSLNQAESDALAIRRSLVDNVPEVQCFVSDMKTFYEMEGNRTFVYPATSYPANTQFTYPLDSTEVNTIMSTNRFVYNTSALPANFDRYFEVATSFWMYNGFRVSNTGGLDLGPQLQLYNTYLGEQKDDMTVETTFGNTGFIYPYGTRLRYAAIVINTTIESSNFGYPRGIPIRDTWEDYITRKMATLPSSLQGGFQISLSRNLDVWHWFKVQKTLAHSALTGIGIGIGVAFPILVFATNNVFVGLLATFTICCITCSVIAVIPLAGWKLGLLESLNLVLVVGLAVDYVVHLAEGYSRAVYSDRKRRTQSALEEVGISVLSGAITTLGAAVFLLGAFILFFGQFGVFLFSTIGFSILYALGMFTTLIALIGPQGQVGSLQPMWDCCFSKCRGSKQSTISSPESPMDQGGPPTQKF